MKCLNIILILTMTFIFTSFGWAGEKAIIQQMKGRRAVILFEKDIPFSVGQKVFLVSEDGSELGINKANRNPLERKNSIGLSASLGTINTTPSTTYLSLSTRYGWNKQQYEVGPKISISYSKQGSNGSTEASQSLFGGFFDYNMIPNVPGEDYIWGVFAEASIGNFKSGTASYKFLSDFSGGVFATVFAFSPMLALRTNFFLENTRADKKTTTTTGFSFGLSHYF